MLTQLRTEMIALCHSKNDSELALAQDLDRALDALPMARRIQLHDAYEVTRKKGAPVAAAMRELLETAKREETI